MTAVTLATIRHNVDGSIVEGTITVDPDLAVFIPRPKPVEITAFAFYDRFTDAEKLAVQTAANADPQIALGLTHGLAKGSVTLTGATLKAWMDGLVNAGAITVDRQIAILTP
jgi:hypothetical protein